MSEHEPHDPTDPIQDFKIPEGHLYDPGYWLTQLPRKGRFHPYYSIMRRAHPSSLYRALLMTLILGQIPLYALLNLGDSLHYAWLWSGSALVVMFFGFWYLIHKSMVRPNRRPASGEIHHPHDGEHHEHT
jgi:hypothetical protein